jgi:hypothetical protein
MKHLLALLLISLSGYVVAGPNCDQNPNNPNCSGDYPGSVPSWDDRYSVTCDMSDVNSGALQASFTEGNLDYLGAGSLMVYLSQGLVAWHQTIIDSVGSAGADTSMMPRIDSLLLAE